MLPIFTIGHSNYGIEDFLALVKNADITAIADVRSQPFSRWVPHFNQEALQASLKREGVAYVWLGRELGARRDETCCYVNGKVSYDRVMETKLFKAGLDRLKTGARAYRIAMMCAEKEPMDCHRTILVARALEQDGLPVKHVLPDGTVEDHADTLNRLLDSLGMPRSDLFLSHDELVDQAYGKRENQIAPDAV